MRGGLRAGNVLRCHSVIAASPARASRSPGPVSESHSAHDLRGWSVHCSYGHALAWQAIQSINPSTAPDLIDEPLLCGDCRALGSPGPGRPCPSLRWQPPPSPPCHPDSSHVDRGSRSLLRVTRLAKRGARSRGGGGGETRIDDTGAPAPSTLPHVRCSQGCRLRYDPRQIHRCPHPWNAPGPQADCRCTGESARRWAMRTLSLALDYSTRQQCRASGDGTAFGIMRSSGTSRGIWGTAPNDVRTVGASASHWYGQTWKSTGLTPTISVSDKALYAVGGSATRRRSIATRRA